MVAQTPGCRARRSLRRRPGTKCQEWRKKKRSVPEGQDDCVGAAFDSVTELSTCQRDLCRLTRENMIILSLRDGLLFLRIPGTSCLAWSLALRNAKRQHKIKRNEGLVGVFWGCGHRRVGLEVGKTLGNGVV